MGKIYTSYADLPKLTPRGFMKIKCPPKIWGNIVEIYNLLLQFPSERESLEGLHPHDPKNDYFTELFPLKLIPNLTQFLQESLQPMHEWFCGEELNPSAVWGIRSYGKGAMLPKHVDWLETHQISSIIMVDKDLGEDDKDWPLQFHCHDGSILDVYTEPGDIILYESAICQHGRPSFFKGNFFRNFYVHYTLKNWEYLKII